MLRSTNPSSTLCTKYIMVLYSLATGYRLMGYCCEASRILLVRFSSKLDFSFLMVRLKRETLSNLDRPHSRLHIFKLVHVNLRKRILINNRKSYLGFMASSTMTFSDLQTFLHVYFRYYWPVSFRISHLVLFLNI